MKPKPAKALFLDYAQANVVGAALARSFVQPKGPSKLGPYMEIHV